MILTVYEDRARVVWQARADPQRKQQLTCTTRVTYRVDWSQESKSRSAEIVGRVIPFFLAKIPDHELAGVRVRARPRANEAAGASRRSFQFSAGAVRMGSSESVAASTVSAGRLAAISRSAGERFRPRRQSQPPISRHSTPAMTSSPIFTRSSLTSVSREASCHSWFPEKPASTVCRAVFFQVAIRFGCTS